MQFPIEAHEGVFPATKVDCLGQIAYKILVEIDDLREEGNEHYKKEVADSAILGQLLAKAEGVDEKIFAERHQRFMEKVKENS